MTLAATLPLDGAPSSSNLSLGSVHLMSWETPPVRDTVVILETPRRNRRPGVRG